MSSQGTSTVKTESSSNKRSFRHEGTSVIGFYWRRPGTALEWSLKMVELLAGKDKRDEVAAGMVLHPAIAWLTIYCTKNSCIHLFAIFVHLVCQNETNLIMDSYYSSVKSTISISFVMTTVFVLRGLRVCSKGSVNWRWSRLNSIYIFRCFRKVITFNLLFSSRRSLSSSSWGRFRDCSGLTGIVGWRFNFGKSFGTGVPIPSACSRSTIRNGS